ncbi:hypothetical protein QA784_15110, partial [Listeria monocytogenes]|nr:hypothetical protein [Listeria monocytogenes]
MSAFAVCGKLSPSMVVRIIAPPEKMFLIINGPTSRKPERETWAKMGIPVNRKPERAVQAKIRDKQKNL